MVQEMPAATELSHLVTRLAEPESATNDAERIDLLSSLEALKSAATAAQARVTVAFDASQRADQAARGVPAKDQGRGVAAQVALARRDSPNKGGRHLGLAKALVREMPLTLRALAAGEISEWRATIIVRETATLRPEHRAAVDRALAGRLGHLGDRAVERETRKLAYQLDPASAIRRVRGAQADRRVSLRPAPDTMTYLTGFLPVAQGVAVHAALSKHADTARSAGDSRTRGQIMADTLVERITGQATAGAVPVAVNLVMTDRALLGADSTPAHLHGYGPIPAAVGRQLLRSTGVAADGANNRANDRAEAWVRRLYTSPVTGDLVAMDSRRREFTGLLREFLITRDETCRTPWCDAPVRHLDHSRPVAAGGGRTTAANAQGLCEACNYTKEALGWVSAPGRASPGHPITVTTPTGHRYTSTAPDPPGERPHLAAVRALGPHTSSLEERFRTVLPTSA